MPGKAFMADVVKRDMARIVDLMDAVRSDLECGNYPKEEFKEIEEIAESYNAS